jgi:transketolase
MNRERLISISIDHKLSHVGSCLTALPIIEEIYAKKRDTDRFVLSSGHAHLAHLVVMEEQGLVNAEEMLEKYGIHCDRNAGCDVSTGSLGLGLPVAVGMAISDREKDVYCLISDGEMAEGSIWEALEVARRQKLTNLKLYVNANGWSAYDKTEPEVLKAKLEAFGVDFEWRDTNSDIGTWAIGLTSHYKQANDELI